VIAQVVASERATAQTLLVTANGGLGLRYRLVFGNGRRLERRITEGDNPVHEIKYILSSIQSTAGSETPCRNMPAPSGKAKYSQETDSALVL
jgi:hypothetical protein